ncbi:hypothetical protein WISP_73987 [Willisornis vidua]|uniref:Uncharacterized protein n=1 Tax=Willisornis vidua TaxID=1566151 RepID=A0ABQ9D9J8_9PASS|nr:hypothetical protein WISP_73987 [Willisornis vidua]
MDMMGQSLEPCGCVEAVILHHPDHRWEAEARDSQLREEGTWLQVEEKVAHRGFAVILSFSKEVGSEWCNGVALVLTGRRLSAPQTGDEPDIEMPVVVLGHVLERPKVQKIWTISENQDAQKIKRLITKKPEEKSP